MDITEHYRELGLKAGASLEEIVRSYRRRILQVTGEGDDSATISDIDRQKQSAADAFSALNRITAKGTSDAGSTVKNTDASRWQESEVFRFQRSPVCKTSLSFTPAKAPMLPAGSAANKPHPLVQKAPESPLISTLGIGGTVVLILAFALNFTTEKRIALPPQSGVSPPVADERAKTVPVESPIVAEPVRISSGRIVVRSNRPNIRIELKSADGLQSVASKRFDKNLHELIDLPAGDYRLIAHLEGWAPITRTVTLFPAKEVETLLEFKSGSLRLESDPSGAVVQSGNRVLGKTPLLLADLPASSQTFSLRYDWWPESQITRTIPEGTELKVSVRFLRGRLIVNSSPPGAVLLVDGKEFGRTPITLEQIPAGQRKLLLRAQEYHPLEFDVNVVDGDDLKISPVLSSALARLDPNSIITDAWRDSQPSRRQQDTPTNSSGVRGASPRNGIVRNLDRQILDSRSLGLKFRYAATIKSYDSKSGQLEFTEQEGMKSKYRVVAQLALAPRSDKGFTNKLLKGAMIEISGLLSAVEEPRWLSKTITLEIDQAVPIN